MRLCACKESAARRGLAQLVIAFVFAGTGCSSTRNNSSDSPAGSGGGGASVSVGTGGTHGASGNAGAKSNTGTGGTHDASANMPAVDGGVKPRTDAGGTGGAPEARDGGASDSGGPSIASCLDDIADYENAGPFQFEASSAGSIKFWVPIVPAGCKVPVIHFANGTGASCSSYQGIHERMATHGFLATCYENTRTGVGDQGILAFDAAFAMYPELADNKLGSIGHEQGGQGAFILLELAEKKWGDKMVYAGFAMEPASGSGTVPAGETWLEAYAKIKSPLFMFSGTEDGLVSEDWVQQAFDAVSPTTEAYWYSAVGATHIPVPVKATQAASIPWFRWKLLGDQNACAFFKKLPDGDDWDARMSQNEQPCR